MLKCMYVRAQTKEINPYFLTSKINHYILVYAWCFFYKNVCLLIQVENTNLTTNLA
jgi:hypothetical protein